MDFVFPMPYTPGEWLAWAGAALTVLFGLVAMLAPRFLLRALALQPIPEHAEALATPRSLLGGFYAGIGLSAILFSQPLIYMTLGFAWAFAAFGRALSILFDHGGSLIQWTSLAVTLLLAALPLLFVFGLVP
ncbi:DUF4345 domain-containing protein [Chelativorans sp. Marseille-P2723]|uniref:AGROH133_08824 family phage infection protein n=1 Tax=Chelativorans sp. Marseille-P2723 TaxID=2709133 RepID=UPI00156F864A|nr:DUF4345 domain-containing protein [Chelativorans sp. Marseille-P2723]